MSCRSQPVSAVAGRVVWQDSTVRSSQGAKHAQDVLRKRALAYFDRVAAGDNYFFGVESEESVRPEDHVEASEKQLNA